MQQKQTNMKAKIKITNSSFESVFDEIVDINSPKDIFVYDNYDADVSVEINGKWCDMSTYEDSLYPDDGIYAD